ncbi:MAG: retroviral-like aspartic protease family protein [Cellvibrionaceae bacterium]|nr:retroviral-like aspartic protease family protein [Cellvibrionaceae bacterium]
MDEHSQKIVNIATARMKTGEARKEPRLEMAKKISFITAAGLLLAWGIYSYEPDITEPYLNAAEPKTSYLNNGQAVVTIKQDSQGHYLFIGEINGKKVKFLLDTGATLVAVPPGVARYLGLPFGQSVKSHTANGESISYLSRARQIKVGGITLNNIEASIATGFEGDTILLGMSFLKNLSVKQEAGKMYLSRKTLSQEQSK